MRTKMTGTNNGYASRESFLKPAQRRFKDVTLPVTGEKYKIRSLTEGEKEAYEASLLTAKGDVTKTSLTGARRRLVVLCLCNGSNERILSDADIDAMKELDGADLAYLQDEIQQHVGFKAGDIEGLVKNCEPAHAAD
jgi:hypothetical protein